MGEARKYVALLVFIETWYAELVGMSGKLKLNLGIRVFKVYKSVLVNCIGEILGHISGSCRSRRPCPCETPGRGSERLSGVIVGLAFPVTCKGGEA
ncbi:MAG: hypothetical protein ACYSU3_01495 [Planctomycetota bacterium]|jgi:hypothetical protein